MSRYRAATGRGTLSLMPEDEQADLELTRDRRQTEGQWKVRCTAKSKSTGKQCRAYAVQGASVCVRHGAAKGTPARRAAEVRMETAVDKAKRRISEAADDAAKHLVSALSSPDEKVALRAALEVLDRNGLAAVNRTEVAIHGDPAALDRQIEAAIKSIARDSGSAGLPPAGALGVGGDT